jgi:hypothetical protein
MKKASINKKLSFKKGLVANLNEEEAHAIQGGQDNTSIWWPCVCPPPPSQQSKIPCACPPLTQFMGQCNCGGSFKICDTQWDLD